MIYGIGHDVLDMKRMDKLMTGRHAERFMERLLTQEEQILAASRGGKQTEFVAGRFAAKEAISKAFGSGIGRLIGFRDMEVLPDALGRPVATLSKDAWERLGMEGPDHYTIHLTISHQTTLASAFAVVEKIK
ncbi:holo-ACP synthase [Paenibacillus solani]|uniref:Holo-[acyl-carrier-protein] synthase n=1 Tax=Paenibacillus solani TaxID=1705565 RepID=A0A0M1N4L8_9BACL|nr:holo-ACP synthase [Paenibacillus solani]KOR76960.1 4'-phosphopantetheinyl transferase [Paenibacillus solani]